MAEYKTDWRIARRIKMLFWRKLWCYFVSVVRCLGTNVRPCNPWHWECVLWGKGYGKNAEAHDTIHDSRSKHEPSPPGVVYWEDLNEIWDWTFGKEQKT